MKKIIFVRSNPVNPDPRVEKEALTLAKTNNFKITILGWDRENNSLSQEIKKYYKIKRFKLKAPYGKFSLLFFLPIWWVYEFFFLLSHDFDIVHCCDFDTLLPGLLVAKIKNKKIIYDIFDFYSACLPERFPKFLRKFLSLLECFLANLTNKVILVDENRISQVNNKIKNYIIIYNSPKEVPIKNFKFKNFDNKKFIIFYGGVLYQTRGFKQILEATKDIKNVELIIAGFGGDTKELISLFKKYPKVKFIGKISYEKVIENTLKCDMLFALYDPKIPNHKFSSPNKLFESMMCGKPILVSKDTSMDKIVEGKKCGLIVNYENVESIKKAILKIKNDMELKEKLGINGRKAYKEEYSWGIMEERLKTLYNKL